MYDKEYGVKRRTDSCCLFAGNAIPNNMDKCTEA